MSTKMIISGILYLLMIITGVVLTKSGKPYNMAISTFHKLVSLAAIVFIVLTIIQLEKISGISSGQWIMIVISGISFLLAIGTGGFIVGHDEAPKLIHILHKITPAIVFVLSFIILYGMHKAS